LAYYSYESFNSLATNASQRQQLTNKYKQTKAIWQQITTNKSLLSATKTDS